MVEKTNNPAGLRRHLDILIRTHEYTSCYIGLRQIRRHLDYSVYDSAIYMYKDKIPKEEMISVLEDVIGKLEKKTCFNCRNIARHLESSYIAKF